MSHTLCIITYISLLSLFYYILYITGIQLRLTNNFDISSDMAC